MEVDFTSAQEAFIRQAVASGRYSTAEDAVRDALARWENSERSRAELMAALDEADADLEAGRYANHSGQTLHELASELKREARSLRQQS